MARLPPNQWKYICFKLLIDFDILFSSNLGTKRFSEEEKYKTGIVASFLVAMIPVLYFSSSLKRLF